MNSPGNSIASRDIKSYLHPYTNLKAHEQNGPLVITRGAGIHVYDEDGKAYIEGMAGLWCTALGFGEERLVEAATQAMRNLPFYHGFNSKTTPVAVDLAERLLSLAPVPMSKVFFANSGSEANDSVIKLVVYYNNARGLRHKKKIIARERGYHGVTVASASLTGLPNNHRAFDLPLAGILHTDCPYPYRGQNPGESAEDYATRLAENLETLIQEEGPHTVAAFIAEPVMGAGGVIVPPKTYFEKIQAVLRKYDVLMIADEVICGFHRTGNTWGSETFTIQPDIMTMAKALSSAYLPISAVMINEEIYQAIAQQSATIGTFGHGFTYSGHPVSAAVALETLKIYEERDMSAHVNAVAPRLWYNLETLRDHPLVGDVRGVGLLAGLELVADKVEKTPFDPKQGVGAAVAKRAEQHGLILRALGDTLAICPPLIIETAEIDALAERLTRALDDIAAEIRGN
ncbi:MAG: aspartate aminotransferase family protein [Magnetospiraceae bacterium]